MRKDRITPCPPPRADLRRVGGDHGATLVEFAILAPLLFVIVFGVIEFGYTFAQLLDVRQGAREGVRLFSVNYQASPSQTGTAQTSYITSATCDRMSFGPGANVSWSTSGAAGDGVTVTVRKPIQQLTGFYATILDGKSVSSTVTMRMERTATFAPLTDSRGVTCP